MLSDIGDEYSATHNGKSNAGFYQGLVGVVFIVASSTQAVLYGIVMTILDYDSSAVVPTTSTLLAVNMVAIFIPAFFMLASAVLMHGYAIKLSNKPKQQ